MRYASADALDDLKSQNCLMNLLWERQSRFSINCLCMMPALYRGLIIARRLHTQAFQDPQVQCSAQLSLEGSKTKTIYAPNHHRCIYYLALSLVVFQPNQQRFLFPMIINQIIYAVLKHFFPEEQKDALTL